MLLILMFRLENLHVILGICAIFFIFMENNPTPHEKTGFSIYNYLYF